MGIAIEILVDIIIAIFSLVIGVIGKSIFDHYSDKNHRKYQIRLEQMVKRYNGKLTYYWPIYLYLSMSYTGWNHIKKGNKYIAKMDRVKFEKNTIIPLHEKICDILTEGIQTIEPDNGLMTEILTYICHVRAYKFLRSHEKYDKLYPRNIGCQFPDKFAKLIIKNLKEIQNDSCELLGNEEDITKKQIVENRKHFFGCLFNRKRSNSTNSSISSDTSTSDIENRFPLSPKKTFLQSLDYSTIDDHISFAEFGQDTISRDSDTDTISSLTNTPPSQERSPHAREYIDVYHNQTTAQQILDNLVNSDIQHDDNSNISTNTDDVRIEMVENKDP
jgi:hypothetical protein